MQSVLARTRNIFRRQHYVTYILIALYVRRDKLNNLILGRLLQERRVEPVECVEDVREEALVVGAPVDLTVRKALVRNVGIVAPL